MPSNIPRQPVQSSNIKSIGHDGDKTLSVEFKNGGVYHYHDVTPAQHAALVGADSVGGHFHSNIKGGSYTKM
jgi:hypothetical protein